MRYAILSDIHGNLPALEAVLADLSRQCVDEILIAGDIVSGCPYPRETLDLIRSQDCRCIRGNNESYLLSMYNRTCHPDMLANLQWGATRWAYQQLTPAGLEWIASLPSQLSLDGEGEGIRMVHGNLLSENAALVPDREEGVITQLEAVHLLKPGQPIQPLAQLLQEIGERVLISGHIHVPWLQREGKKLALNPGSVGMPVTGNPHAQYALLTWESAEWQVEFRHVAYDRARVRQDFRTSGMLEAGTGFARASMLDLDRAANTVWFFVEHAFALARARGLAGAFIPDAIWLEAVATFDWGED